MGNPMDLLDIPKDYHEFADVFDKKKAYTLPPHRPYNLKIETEEGAVPPSNCMYSLSQLELEALRVFIEENVRSGFIRHSKSAHRAPILLIEKKDGDLRLCVDYRSLNCLTKKDHYPLPLISYLLDTLQKAHIFTKIDLCHAYHLVRIADGDEWKTTFRTHYGSFEWLVVPDFPTDLPPFKDL